MSEPNTPCPSNKAPYPFDNTNNLADLLIRHGLIGELSYWDPSSDDSQTLTGVQAVFDEVCMNNGWPCEKKDELNRKLDKFIRSWLASSTCYRHQTGKRLYWRSECGSYVILKHCGHTEYLDRVHGSERCGTYYCLFDISQTHKSGLLAGEYHPIHKWCGRWNNQFIIEACDMIEEANCESVDKPATHQNNETIKIQ